MNNKLVCFLKSHNLKISTMESCTGGKICDLLTDIEGCSSVLEGGYVTYTNEQKIRCGVPKDIIDFYGVYSTKCAEAMAKACKNNTNSDIGIGVTGTFGNIDNNNSDSQIGEIYYAIAIKDVCYCYKIILDSEIINAGRVRQKEFVVDIIFTKLIDLLNTIVKDGD